YSLSCSLREESHSSFRQQQPNSTTPWVSSLKSFLLKFVNLKLIRLSLLSNICWFNFSGKVHGSLARAGKVRGQTPKVAKQDKKKKPRGRAHKRMQYNRRFVTAVVGFGKKRGPNSSEK
ncbi:40S ribosomal protein S30, partial [Melia azedarach]